MIRAGYYQFRPLFGKPQRNLRKVIAALTHISADIIVLPELCFSGYYFKNREETTFFAEEISSSAIILALLNLCREKDFFIVTGFAEKDKDRLFNSAVLLGPQGIVSVYRKLHLFNEEKNWFDPGDLPLQVQSVRDVKIGMMVCFDWIFPEVTRSLALSGADIVCHPSNLVLDYCQQTMLARCIENNIFAITANRFGKDKRPQGQLNFTGKSQIVAPRGKLLCRAPAQKEQIKIMELDINLARDKHITALNELNIDRRPEFYRILVNPMKIKV